MAPVLDLVFVSERDADWPDFCDGQPKVPSA